MKKIIFLLCCICTIFCMFSVCNASTDVKYYNEELYGQHVPITGAKLYLNRDLSGANKCYILYSDGIVEYYETKDDVNFENIVYFQLSADKLKEIDENINNGNYRISFSNSTDSGRWGVPVFDENGKSNGTYFYIYEDVIEIFRKSHESIKTNDNVILNKNIKIKYNEQYYSFSDANGKVVYPISYNGTTYLPIRAISSLFGTEIAWDGNENTVYLGKGELDSKCSSVVNSFDSMKNETVNVFVNSKIKIVYKNERQLFKDANKNLVYPLSYQGTTYLPVRAISNLFNAEITWIGEKNEIEIVYNKQSLDMSQSLEINNMIGTYKNLAGETINYTTMRNDFYYDVGFSYIEADKNDIGKFIDSKMTSTFERNTYMLEFEELNAEDFTEEIPSEAQYVLTINNMFSKGIIDFYKLSDDKLKLISINRGNDYDLIKVSSEYSMENYLSDVYDQNNIFNGIYRIDGTEYPLVMTKNYALGDREAIGWFNDNEVNYYWKDSETEPTSYVLKLYLENKDLTKIKDIYSCFYYANYYSGIIVYENGKVEYIAAQMGSDGSTIIADVKQEVTIRKINDCSIDSQIKSISKMYIYDLQG